MKTTFRTPNYTQNDEISLHQWGQQVSDGVRVVPDAVETHVVAIARVVRGYLGIEQVQVRRQPVSRSGGRWAREKQRNISIVGRTSTANVCSDKGTGGVIIYHFVGTKKVARCPPTFSFGSCQCTHSTGCGEVAEP